MSNSEDFIHEQGTCMCGTTHSVGVAPPTKWKLAEPGFDRYTGGQRAVYELAQATVNSRIKWDVTEHEDDPRGLSKVASSDYNGHVEYTTTLNGTNYSFRIYSTGMRAELWDMSRNIKVADGINARALVKVVPETTDWNGISQREINEAVDFLAEQDEFVPYNAFDDE